MGSLKVGMNIVLKRNSGYGLAGHCYIIAAVYKGEIWLKGRQGMIMLTNRQIEGNIEGC